MDESLVILFLACICFMLGIILFQRAGHLIKNGRKARAIIFKNNVKYSKDGPMYYPVVRFLTDDQQWITQELNIGYSPAMEEGMKLEVIYDPEDPTVVEINSRFHLKILPKVLIILGIVGIAFGALVYLEVFNIESIPHVF